MPEKRLLDGRGTQYPEGSNSPQDFVAVIHETLDHMAPKERREWILPPGIEFNAFVAECGKVFTSFEIGGLFNPKTRSLLISKGFASEDRHAFSNPSVEFIPPRRNTTGGTDDDFWHTHPSNHHTTQSYSRRESDGCLPSDTDNDALLMVSLIEFDEGYGRPFSSTIGCGGYVSVTTAHGIQFDEERLRSMGISTTNLREVKALLALGPPIWIGNLAKEGNAERLWHITELYYAKKLRQDGSFARDIDQLLAEASTLLAGDTRRGEPTAGSKLRDAILLHAPKYPPKHRLTNVGVPSEIADEVIRMIGIETVVIKQL